jgi:hypothetical protein
MKLQDEHSCLSLITNQIIKIHQERGFWTEVMGWCVCVKLWIHFIACDTSGHNNLVGHMNGGWPKFIYQDCRCLIDDLSSPIPMCSFITSVGGPVQDLSNFQMAPIPYLSVLTCSTHSPHDIQKV